MKFPRTDISACDHCGVCCSISPCLLSSPAEVAAISDYLQCDIRPMLSIEQRADRKWEVRASAPGQPCQFFSGRCMINAVKPKGGRDFECWRAETFALQYLWTISDLRQAGLTHLVPTKRKHREP